MTSRKIYKFVWSEGPLRMQSGAEILHIEAQRGSICIWAAVDPNAKEVYRNIRAIGTGHLLPDGGKYIGTIQHGPFVWHFFDYGEF